MKSRAAFLEDVREWATHDGDTPELEAWLRAAEAALRLDAVELRNIARPIVRSWSADT